MTIGGKLGRSHARLCAPLVFVCVVSCGGTRDETAVDAGAASTSPRALSIARAIPAAAVRLARAHARFAGTDLVSARLPETSRGALRVERSSMIWVEVTPEAIEDRPGKEHDAVVSYDDVARDTDALMLFDGAHAEELRVLRSAAAPTSFSWRLRLGPGLDRVNVVEGTIQLLDAERRARLRAAPLVAWDSAGHTRALQVEVETLGPGEARVSARLDPAGLVFPVVVDPAWGSVTIMNAARFNARMVRLPSGKLLAVGGLGAGSGVQHASAEVFDPATLGWTLVASMSDPRHSHALAVLPSGKVLVVGGRGASGATVSSAEIYDPATDAWSGTTAPATTNLAYGSLVTVGGKTLYAAHGNSATATDTGYVYDEGASTWTLVSNKLSSARMRATAVALGPTRAWIVGSGTGTDFWDSTTGLFTAGPTLNASRGNDPGVVVLTSGRALVVGGSRSDAELYDPATGLSVVTGIPSTHPGSSMLAALPGDRAIFVGGTSGGLASSLFEGASKAWSAGPSAISQRVGGLVGELADGRVLVAAGTIAGTATAASELFATASTAGTTCSADAQCASGFCSFGVCCDRACTGACESCTETGSVGICKTIAGTPRPGHGTCGGAGTCAGTCDGTSATCTAPGTGTACVTATCVGGIEQPPAYCTGSGTCAATPATKPCAPYVCGATSCKTSCTADADCVATAFCDTSTSKCSPKAANGAACTADAACTSGHCANGAGGAGVCCDRACAGGCESCALSGGVGLCQILPKDAACGKDACVGSVLTKAATCDGTSGACPAPTPTPCPGSLVCADATTCKSTCAVGSDCTTGYCDLATSTCAAKPGDAGAVDSGPEDAGAVAEAGAPKLPATPAVGEIQRCTKSSECATGFCVDGVCCDSACTDRCHSCALLSSPGKCTVEPIGVDLRNECGPANQCLGTCDGAGQCIGAGAGTMCGRNRCTGPSSGVGAAYCSAPGATCPLDDAVPFDCEPYACEPAFGACLTTCSGSEDCAHDFVCDVPSKSCVPRPSPAADEGGCTYGRGGSGDAALGILACAIGLVVRRRRDRLAR